MGHPAALRLKYLAQEAIPPLPSCCIIFSTLSPSAERSDMLAYQNSLVDV